MRRALALVGALAASGCVHTDLERNSPGRVDLAEPPRSPDTRAVEAPNDPGQRAIVVHASLMGGGGATTLDGAARSFVDTGVEASVTSNTLERGFRGGIMGPRDPWRANLGWMFFRRSEDKERIGPSYAELQYTAFDELKGASIAVGAAWEWRTPAAGPQATACFGAIPFVALCVRGTYIVSEGAEVGVRLVMMAGLLEWVWNR